MARVRLVHWNPPQAEPILEALRQAGHQIEYEPNPPELLRQIRREPPDVVVIDLTRLPSHGREAAITLRASKATRAIPLVFLDGDPAKVEALREQLPDAVFCRREHLAQALRKALQRPSAPLASPPVMMERYHNRTAAQKLGIREGMQAGVTGAPRDYIQVLGALPPGAELVEDPPAPLAVTLWFVRDPEAYQQGLATMRDWASRTKLWVLWPKQQGGKPAGITGHMVRQAALEVGLVDYKICSVNAVWSGMAFARRK